MQPGARATASAVRCYAQETRDRCADTERPVSPANAIWLDKERQRTIYDGRRIRLRIEARDVRLETACFQSAGCIELQRDRQSCTPYIQGSYPYAWKRRYPEMLRPGSPSPSYRFVLEESPSPLPKVHRSDMRAGKIHNERSLREVLLPADCDRRNYLPSFRLQAFRFESVEPSLMPPLKEFSRAKNALRVELLFDRLHHI